MRENAITQKRHCINCVLSHHFRTASCHANADPAKTHSFIPKHATSLHDHFCQPRHTGVGHQSRQSL